MSNKKDRVIAELQKTIDDLKSKIEILEMQLRIEIDAGQDYYKQFTSSRDDLNNTKRNNEIYERILSNIVNDVNSVIDSNTYSSFKPLSGNAYPNMISHAYTNESN